MADIHKFVGILVVIAFGLTAFWGLYALARRLDPGKVFWTLVAIAQVVIGVQVILGILLLIFEGLPDDRLHLVYGLLSGGAFIYAHLDARNRTDRPWVPFVWAIAVAFLLSLRALQTGLASA